MLQKLQSFRWIQVFARCQKSKYFFRPCADPHQCYDQITKFLKVVNKHASIKKKTVKRNDAPFVNKELRKAIHTWSDLRNKFCK